MLWHLKIAPAPGQADLEGPRVVEEASELGISGPWRVAASRGYLIEGQIEESKLRKAAEALLVDPVGESLFLERCGPDAKESAGSNGARLVHVLRRPGVTDPAAESARDALRDLGHDVEHCRSVRTFAIEGPADKLDDLIGRILANEAVEVAVVGPIQFDRLGQGQPYQFHRVEVPIRGMDDEALLRKSREGKLAMSLEEMKAVQSHFAELGRDPTDCELETIAQTWSEHCSHKTLRGVIDFEGERIDNLLKQTIFGATNELNLDWMVSVFEDNAGVVRFDDEHDVCFKVETHNHPSAIDPYGGSNTGIGGVIRDILGTGRAARPIGSTNVFCVAPPDTPAEALPPGVIHPRRVLEGVVAGVRDYGNRMGIPTVNGALVTDPRYLATPLVFCGTVGVLPHGLATKWIEPGDRIVAIGGRTGRDGIHGATVSSIEMTSEGEALSGGAVQIGHATTQKKLLDVLLEARDRGLFHSVTDCGAGGFSSAIGEMGAEIGAEVDLDQAPLKYEGLSYTEIWISEAQERMVLAVPEEKWPEFRELCEREFVEAADLGRFVPTGRLVLRYQGHEVCDLDMHFLHEGRPEIYRQARFTPPPAQAIDLPQTNATYNDDLHLALRDWNVASKEWIIRQYDHGVQGRTVLNPLVGAEEDGPGDASVMLPVAGSTRGLAIACGINPSYGDLDPYQMAACAIDEAIRNCVAVGADPERIALLDNFSWGNTERPETLGSLVLAAKACRDLALAYRSPFISGKDSLYNEYVHEGQSLAIPGTLLISAIGQVPDVRRCVTMDLKEADNVLLILGATHNHLGGSVWAALHGQAGGQAPKVDPTVGLATFQVIHELINQGLIRACHDLSDGGLAVALAEMALAGNLGASVQLGSVPVGGEGADHDAVLLFSESPSRFLIEVQPGHLQSVLEACGDRVPVGQLGKVTAGSKSEAEPQLTVLGRDGKTVVIDATTTSLRSSWKRPF